MKIWKIHGKFKYSESQHCFANISVTEAGIFLKFYLVGYYYLVSFNLKFHKDPCMNAHSRVVNARMHIISRVRAFTTCVRAFVHKSS